MALGQSGFGACEIGSRLCAHDWNPGVTPMIDLGSREQQSWPSPSPGPRVPPEWATGLAEFRRQGQTTRALPLRAGRRQQALIEKLRPLPGGRAGRHRPCRERPAMAQVRAARVVSRSVASGPEVTRQLNLYSALRGDWGLPGPDELAPPLENANEEDSCQARGVSCDT